MKRRLAFVLFISCMAGCKCHNEACLPGQLAIEVKGFDTSELQGIIMRQFDTAGFYTTLFSTIPNKEIIRDTVNGIPHTWLTVGPRGGNNWEIVFPAVQKTVRIYNLAYDYKTQQICNGGGDKPLPCVSLITSYNQDGAVHKTIAPRADHSDFIQIQR